MWMRITKYKLFDQARAQWCWGAHDAILFVDDTSLEFWAVGAFLRRAHGDDSVRTIFALDERLQDSIFRKNGLRDRTDATDYGGGGDLELDLQVDEKALEAAGELIVADGYLRSGPSYDGIGGISIVPLVDPERAIRKDGRACGNKDPKRSQSVLLKRLHTIQGHRRGCRRGEYHIEAFKFLLNRDGQRNAGVKLYRLQIAKTAAHHGVVPHGLGEQERAEADVRARGLGRRGGGCRGRGSARAYAKAGMRCLSVDEGDDFCDGERREAQFCRDGRLHEAGEGMWSVEVMTEFMSGDVRVDIFHISVLSFELARSSDPRNTRYAGLGVPEAREEMRDVALNVRALRRPDGTKGADDVLLILKPCQRAVRIVRVCAMSLDVRHVQQQASIARVGFLGDEYGGADDCSRHVRVIIVASAEVIIKRDRNSNNPLRSLHRTRYDWRIRTPPSHNPPDGRRHRVVRHAHTSGPRMVHKHVRKARQGRE